MRYPAWTSRGCRSSAVASPGLQQSERGAALPSCHRDLWWNRHFNGLLYLLLERYIRDVLCCTQDPVQYSTVRKYRTCILRGGAEQHVHSYICSGLISLVHDAQHNLRLSAASTCTSGSGERKEGRAAPHCTALHCLSVLCPRRVLAQPCDFQRAPMLMEKATAAD